MTACVIDGQRCTKCCQAIFLPKREMKHIIDAPANSDRGFVRDNWTSISWRRAKKINPYLAVYMRLRHATGGVKPSKFKRLASFWTCKHLTPDGCGVYQDRPRVCRDFPRYGYSDEQFAEYVQKNPSEYHPDCTEHAVVVIDNKHDDVQAKSL